MASQSQDLEPLQCVNQMYRTLEPCNLCTQPLEITVFHGCNGPTALVSADGGAKQSNCGTLLSTHPSCALEMQTSTDSRRIVWMRHYCKNSQNFVLSPIISRERLYLEMQTSSFPSSHLLYAHAGTNQKQIAAQQRLALKRDLLTLRATHVR